LCTKLVFWKVYINIHCVNEELFNIKTGSSCMGGRFDVSLSTGKYIVSTVANIVPLLQPLICRWLEWALDSYLVLHVGFIWCQCACGMYYIEWRVLVCCTLAMYVSWKISHQKFCKIYPASTMPCERKVYRLVEKLWTAGSMLDRQNAETVVLLQL